MDRLDLDEEIDLETNNDLQRLKMPSVSRFRPKNGRQPRNEREALIEEIRGMFGQDINFKMMLGIIRNKGLQSVKEVFYETLKKAERGEVDSPRAYFFGWLRNLKVELKEIDTFLK